MLLPHLKQWLETVSHLTQQYTLLKSMHQAQVQVPHHCHGTRKKDIVSHLQSVKVLMTKSKTLYVNVSVVVLIQPFITYQYLQRLNQMNKHLPIIIRLHILHNKILILHLHLLQMKMLNILHIHSMMVEKIQTLQQQQHPNKMQTSS